MEFIRIDDQRFNIVESQKSKVESTVSMTSAETYAFAEVQQRIKQFSYAVGIGAMHTYIEPGGQKSSNRIARPQLTLSYDFLAHKGHDYFRQMLILNFHCNLDFGTQRRENGKRINNEDKENGILSGTK